MEDRKFASDENAKKFLDGLISDPMKLDTECAKAVVETEIGNAFDCMREKDRRLYSKKLHAAGYEAGCFG